MPSIIITSGKQKGRFCRLGQTTNVIGRDENLPIQILDDTISRRHLQILFDHRTWLYAAEDMGSRNGVLMSLLHNVFESNRFGSDGCLSEVAQFSRSHAAFVNFFYFIVFCSLIKQN